MYVNKLRKLLTHALLDLEQAAREPFLLHQFLAGISEAISKQLRASGEVTTLNAAITLAKFLMTIDSELVAILTDKPDEVQLLWDSGCPYRTSSCLINLIKGYMTIYIGALLIVFTVIKWSMYNVTATITNALTVGF